ncbi:primase-helicase family protein [Methylobacterium sp. J-070]|uniref:primase-helicase family protein n=1 Tax=Methylobacterium sp. J-070 TaxID=2836650 RepID=UPI001FBA1902|nr:primase-helicase family protein [Methylobacterium sp. J-070]MCJ2053703.1 DUF5906 domain-containing protein [Methylobacterium sp. J-070]
MAFEEQKKGCERLSAPHPQENQDQSSNSDLRDSTNHQENKGKSTFQKLGSLTDVPALRDYFNRIGAEPRSLKTAVVRESAGKYWRDLAVIRVAKDGKVTAPADYAPTEDEAKRIAEECAGFRWPEIQPLPTLTDLPKMVREADDEDVFEFRDENNMVVMLQVRMERDGERAYVPWTYWDDGEWRMTEPDGPLPLYNAHRLKEFSSVVIHEGAKAARHMQRLVDGVTRKDRDALKAHPWGAELGHTLHIGWIGGALSPHRTDWDALKRAGITRADIVPDNDEVGRSAVPYISKALRCPTFVIQFGEQFPSGFDLADPFPEAMFKGGRYAGPAFRECQHPATWATDLVPNPDGKGRPAAVLRESFKLMWAYVEDADLFVCREMPEIVRNEAVLNKMLASFSHVNDTVRLVLKEYQGRSVRLCYRPGEEGTSIVAHGSSAINLHRPSLIRSSAGDPGPFLDFMKYLFPNEAERVEVEKWCATLIARPSVRMGYGLLLISETQGVGKTTLGQDILAPLVGELNVSFPSEKDIMSDFNEWVANKRLAIVNEIYSGASWKAYQSLKTVITDRFVTVNQKYVRQHTIDNWVHVFACSNSRRALKMENEDRRWFYPEVTETAWPKDRFTAFREWLSGDGLRIIRHWAENYGNYVGPADHAPMTARKEDMIAGSRSDAQAEAAAIAEAVRDLARPAAVALKEVIDFIKGGASGRVFDTDYELRRTMTGCGLAVLPERVKIGGRRLYILVNAAMSAELAELTNDGAIAAMVREKKVAPGDVLNPRF